MALDLIGHVVDIDHGLVDAGFGEAIEHVIDQRLAMHFNERLGQSVGDRSHARAKTGGEHHGGLRHLK